MAVNQRLQRLVQELEYLMQLSSQHIHSSKKRIWHAKDVINMSSCKLASSNEPKQQKDTPCKLTEQAQACYQEDDLLENEIKRILQIAENVRDKVVTKQSQKPKAIHSSYADKKMTRTMKSEAMCSPGVKDAALKNRFTPGVKSVKKTVTKSDVKTVYQKDFSLVKSKSMPSLHSESKSNEVIKCGTLERNCYHQDKKMDPAESKAVGFNNKQCVSRNNKDFIKLNKQNIGMVKKETPRDTYKSKAVPEFASRLLQSSKVNESLLCEELALRSQRPNYSEILMVLREIYHFLTGSNRKAGKKEVMLRENFIERCNSSASSCSSDPELIGTLKNLLPHCGWVYGRNKIITVKDLTSIKDIITELENKLHSIDLSINCNQKNVQSEVICVQNHSGNQENFNMKESPFWHPLVMSSVFQGVELPPFLYYNNVNEWISFQTAVLELHEHYIQLKILECIHPIITEFLGSMDSEDTTTENNVGDRIKSLARLLKAAAVMADFTGHLTVPILAGIKSLNENLTNHC